jgi:SPP1 family predicted phage head-tail adaptor
MIQAGRLIHEVTIETINGESQSATGATTPNWTPAETVMVEIKPLHGRNVEIALARTKGKSVSHQISGRWNDLFKPTTSRINFHGRIFEIFSVVNVLERNIDADLLCNEIVA